MSTADSIAWKTTGREALRRLKALETLEGLTEKSSQLRSCLMKVLPERSGVLEQCVVVLQNLDVGKGSTRCDPGTMWSSVERLIDAIAKSVNKSGDREWLERMRNCVGGEGFEASAAEVATGWAAPERGDRRAAVVEIIAGAVASIYAAVL